MQRLPIDFVQPVKAFVLFVTFAILFYRINTIEEKVGYNSRDKYLIFLEKFVPPIDSLPILSRHQKTKRKNERNRKKI